MGGLALCVGYTYEVGMALLGCYLSKLQTFGVWTWYHGIMCQGLDVLHGVAFTSSFHHTLY